MGLIYLSNSDQAAKRDYLPERQQSVGICNKETLCLFRGTELVVANPSGRAV